MLIELIADAYIHIVIQPTMHMTFDYRYLVIASCVEDKSII